jgi:hypothetical protein
MDTIDLAWTGPFRIQDAEFAPPVYAGLYLWVVGSPGNRTVSYVGQTDNIRRRMYEHVTSLLGGAYRLYDPSDMRAGRMEPLYKPEYDTYFAEFVGKFNTRSRLAYDNLVAYELFWASMEGSARERRQVESALIHNARERGIPNENDRLSVGPDNCPRITVRSELPSGVVIAGIEDSVTYGGATVHDG